MNPLKVRLTNNNAVKEPTHKECRYMQNKNCGSTPSLLRSKEVVPNMNVHLDKENNSINLNSFNRQSEVYARLAKSNSFDQCRSLEFGKRIKTVENDDDTKRDYEDAAGSRVDEQSTVNRSGLINIENNESQILTQPARGISISSYFNGETFGLPSRTGRENLSSSREFMEEKKMKNEVLD